MGGILGEGPLPLGGASPASDSHIHVVLSLMSFRLALSNVAYVWLYGSASSGALDLSLNINWVVPRVLVLCGLLVAQVATSVSRPRHRHD